MWENLFVILEVLNHLMTQYLCRIHSAVSHFGSGTMRQHIDSVLCLFAIKYLWFSFYSDDWLFLECGSAMFFLCGWGCSDPSHFSCSSSSSKQPGETCRWAPVEAPHPSSDRLFKPSCCFLHWHTKAAEGTASGAASGAAAAAANEGYSSPLWKLLPVCFLLCLMSVEALLTFLTHLPLRGAALTSTQGLKNSSLPPSKAADKYTSLKFLF